MLGLVSLALLSTRPISYAQNATAYSLYMPDGRKQLPFRVANGIEVVSLDQLAGFFGLTIAEDAGVGGLTVRGRGQTVLLIPGQSFASIGPGRIVSLPGPIQRERNSWQVPVDFIRLVIAPALNLRVDVRRPSRLIVVGDVRVPRITGRFEKQATGGLRLTIEAQPAAPRRITREGNRLFIRYDATALDTNPISGAVAEFATAARYEGTAVVVDLGPQTVSFRSDEADPSRVVVDLLPAAPPPSPAPPPVTAPPPAAATPPPAAAARPDPADAPVAEAGVPIGSMRTIVIDPGHGGDERGARGPGDLLEKDYVLQLARRLRSAIESRFGLRVLLTRDSDENTPIDQRTSMANNNKAELFISLHANGSVRPATRGAQVLTLSAPDYVGEGREAEQGELPVPVVGGQTRRIDVVPWDLAQIPFADRSAAVAAALVRQLTERGVVLHPTPTARLPLRVLVGANMPAVLLEVGFLTNAEDAAALTSANRTSALIEAVLATVAEVRRGLPAPGERRP